MNNVEKIGIDFGTYSTKIAYIRNNKHEILNLGNDICDYDGFIYSFIVDNKIGIQAYEEYKKGNKNVEYGFKMDILNKVGLEKCKKFLRVIKDRLSKRIDLKNCNIRFSVPNLWQKEREIYKDLLLELGFISENNDNVFISEPYACAFYYFHDEVGKANSRVLIIDAGAGTIDTVVIEITDKGLKDIKESYLSSQKAGKFVDEKIKNYYQLNSLFEAEQLKLKVSYDFSKGLEKTSYNKVFVDIKEFENEVLKDWIDEYEKLLLGYDKDSFDYLIFAGGFSRFYLIEKIAKKIFSGKQVYPKSKDKVFDSKEIKKDSSIAIGCAISIGFELKETLKKDIYWVVEYSIELKKVSYEEQEIEFIRTDRTEGEYEILLFSRNEYVGIEKKLEKFKFNDENIEIRLLSSFKIKVDDNYEILEISEVKEIIGKEIKSLIFRINKDKILEFVFITDDGEEKKLTSYDIEKRRDEKWDLRKYMKFLRRNKI